MDMTNPMPAPTPAPMAPAQAPVDSKEVKVSLSSLPAGTKEGDYVEMCVSRVDKATGMAFLTSEDADKDSEADEPTADGDEESEDAPAKPSLDTKTLLGPMDGLKNYLVQKSVDVPKNQGR